MRDGIAKREQEIRRLAYWDTLTNLPNRAQFLLLLNDSIDLARKRGESLFVLMMDLDRFKHVNDVMAGSVPASAAPAAPSVPSAAGASNAAGAH